MDYLISNPIGNVDIKIFEESCGVGVVNLPEQMEIEVEKVLKLNEKELLEKRLVIHYFILKLILKRNYLVIRYRFNVFPLMSDVRNRLKWADGKVIKSEMEIQVLSLLGPKTEADLAPPPKVEKVKAPKPAASAAKENGGIN